MSEQCNIKKPADGFSWHCQLKLGHDDAHRFGDGSIEPTHEQLRAQLQAAKDEIEGLRELSKKLINEREEQRGRAESAEQQLAAAQAALLKYGKHLETCPDSRVSPCNCGFAEQCTAGIGLAEQPLSALREFVERVIPTDKQPIVEMTEEWREGWAECLFECEANLAKTLGPKET